MKTQKIFLLAFALVLSLFVLASCGASQTGPDCFVFNDEPSFTEPVEIEGEIIGVNEKYNLVAYETRSLDTNGHSIRTVQVVDVSDENRVVFKDSWTKSTDSSSSDAVIDLEDYPIIKISEEYQDGTENGTPVYKTNYKYYLIHEETEASSLSSSSGEDALNVKRVSNVWLIEDEDTVYWVNKNLEIMREIPSDIADTYLRLEYQNPNNYFKFESEYCDYLYTWEFDPENLSQVVIVYDPNGIACAKYSPSYRGFAPSVFVLNDGNVLIQEQRIAEDGEEYDYIFPNGFETYNMILTTKIMNYMTGEITETEFNYLISDLESNYTSTEGSYSFPLTLAEGYDNQAYITPIADGEIGNCKEYVVLDNALNIKWSLNNKYFSESISEIFAATKDGYILASFADGKEQIFMFDWAGNIILEVPTNADEVTDDFYVTMSGIYTYDGKLVFDIENSEFCDAGVEIYGDRIYFIKENDLKLERFKEIYVFNPKTKVPDLIADGEEITCEPLTSDGALVVMNTKKNTMTVYDANGNVALITRADSNIVNYYVCDGAYIIEVEVGGEHKIYIFTFGDQIEAE